MRDSGQPSRPWFLLLIRKRAVCVSPPFLISPTNEKWLEQNHLGWTKKSQTHEPNPERLEHYPGPAPRKGSVATRRS